MVSFTWSGGNGTFDHAASWSVTGTSMTGYPGAGDTADLAASPGTILGPGTAADVYFNGSGTWTLDGHIIAQSTMDVQGIAGENTTLDITTGSTAEVQAPIQNTTYVFLIAGRTSSDGTVLVSGAGALLTTDDNSMVVGYGGTAALIVSQGGSVSAGVAVENSATGNPAIAIGRNVSGLVEVTGAGSQITASGAIYLAHSGTGTLTVEDNGQMIVNHSTIGIDNGDGTTGQTGGAGIINVTTNGTLNVTGGIANGGGGDSGSLLVDGGGKVVATGQISAGDINTINSLDGTGTISIAGTGSSLLTSANIVVGKDGLGGMTVSGGASVVAGASLDLSTTAALNIGANAGAVGTLLLSDTGSTVNLTGQLGVGNAGSGSATIQGGATLSAGDPTRATSSGISIANSADGSGSLLITGMGTQVNDTGRFSVGRNGSGTLNVSGGAVVLSTGNSATSSFSMSIGASTTASGAAQVTGAGTQVNLSYGLVVGGGSTTVAGGGTEVTQGGAGSLAVLNAAVITVAGGAYVTATGSVSIGGGVLETDTASVSAGGAISGFGTLSGAITDDGSITATGGGLTVNGAVSGTGVLALAAASALTLAAPETAPVLFTGENELLSLENGASIGGAVSGVVAGDTFDLLGLPNATAVYSGGGSAASTLTVGSAVITLLGAASSLSFTPQSDGAGGTELVASANAGPDGNLDYLGTGSSNLTSQGADTIVGGSGAATVTASGTPLFFGGAGATLFDLTGASGTLVGGGSETVNAGGANVLQFGGAGSVDFIGGSGASTVIGGAAGNTIMGGSGNLLYFGNGATTYISGTGIDTVVGFDGSLTGTGGMNGTLFFSGLAGNNDISTGPGSSTIIGFGAADSLVAAGGGNNIIAESGTASSIFGGQGTGQNTFFAFGTNDVVQGGAGQTAIESAVGNQTLIAGSGSTLFEILDSGANRAITVTDFNANQDFVELEGYGASAAATALSGASMAGGNELLTLADGTQVTFLGVTNLSAGSFIPTS